MTSLEDQRRRPLVSWVALSVLCLASAVGGGIFVSRQQARSASTPPPESGGASVGGADSSDGELESLRSEVARLSRAVGALAAKPTLPEGAKASAELPPPRHSRPIPKQASV